MDYWLVVLLVDTYGKFSPGTKFYVHFGDDHVSDLTYM